MTAIEWTDATWNPVTGCSKVSPGCAHCYAETLSLRFGWSKKSWAPENAVDNVVLHPERLDKPKSWRTPRMVFVNSMSDLFHEQVPDEFIARVFETMRLSPQHTFQVLTKRPERARDWFDQWSAAFQRFATSIWPLPNVWLGVSVENARFTWRADVLREIPAAIRFISAEPLLGSLFEQALPDRPVADLVASSDANVVREARARILADRRVRGGNRQPLDLDGIDWLIVGGESGPNHRTMHPDWPRELRSAAANAGTAFFFKQWGGRTPKSGGRMLDGREWSEYPQVSARAA